MSDRVSDVETILAALRPTTQVDPDWADAELRRIVATPAAPRRRRWWLAGGAAAAVIALGGTAYAGGRIPNVVTEVLGSGNQAQPIFRVGEVRQVFELTTRDGVHVRYFSAPNETGGQCRTVTYDQPPSDGLENDGFECYHGPINGVGKPDDGVDAVYLDGNWNEAILFGFDTGRFELPDGTRQVRVTGPAIDETVPARTLEGWAVELPANAHGYTYVVEFLDRDGEVLRRMAQPIGAPRP